MKYDVLLAEDDTTIRSLYVDALSMAGITVKTVSNGREAIEAALADHPKLILMDILMPGLGGHVAVAEIRHDDWGKTAKIIYLTNLSDDGSMQAAQKLGSEDFIVKANISINDLVARVKKAIAEVEE